MGFYFFAFQNQLSAESVCEVGVSIAKVAFNTVKVCFQFLKSASWHSAETLAKGFRQKCQGQTQIQQLETLNRSRLL